MVIIDFLKDFYTLFFVWLTCLTAIFVFRKSLIFSYRRFAVFIIFISVLETIGNYLAFKGIKNHFFFNIIYAIELTLIPLFFKYWLQSAGFKKIIEIFVFVFPLFVLVNTLWIQGFFTLQTYSFVLGGSFILLLSVAYLWELYSNEESKTIIRNPPFWFSLAYLIYFAVTVPYLGMLNYLLKNQPAFSELYYIIIIDGTICLYNILLTVGFLCMKSTAK